MTISRARWTVPPVLIGLVAATLALLAAPSQASYRAVATPQAFTVDAGTDHTVQIAGNGTPWAVGRNHEGQLCTADTAPRSEFAVMQGLPSGRKAVQVRAGGSISVVLDDAGALWGCGGTFGVTLTALPGLPAGRKVVDLGVGNQHVVALLDNGRVYGIGRGTEGQISGSSTSPTFIEVAGLHPDLKVVDVAAGGLFTLVLDEFGAVHGTGSNGSGQLGVYPTLFELERMPDQPAGVPIVQVAAGTNHSVILGANGRAYAQGANADGQLASGAVSGNVTTWVRMRGAEDVAWVDGGLRSTVVVTRTGTPLTTGDNSRGGQGRPIAGLVRNVELTEFGTDFFDAASPGFAGIAAGGDSVVARDLEGFVFGTGANSWNQVRPGPTGDLEALRRTSHQVVRSSGGARIEGTVAVGRSLRAGVGSWTPSNVSFQYRWQRDGVTVQFSPSPTYTVASADAGRTLTLAVFSNLQGSNNGTATAPARRVPGVNLARPTISGTAKVGNALAGKRGTWNAPGYTYSYRWLRNGASIPHATKTSYRVTTSDVGKAITLQVTARRSGFSSVVATSAPKRAYR